jgi:uncharacterized membrane protein YeaQ/YmgE (transglycosylase-associated protein family)
MHFLLFLIMGGIAGWLAGKVIKGEGFGLVGNVIIGVIGGFLGGFLFDFLGIQVGGIFGALVTAFAGAVVLVYVVGLIRK